MQNSTLKQFQEISALLNSSLQPEEIKKRAIEAATLLMDAEAGSLLLLDDSTDELYFEVAHGEKGAAVQAVRLKLGQGIAGHVAQTGVPLIVHDVQKDPRFFRGADRRSGFTTRNMMCTPVKVRAKLIGVLQVINRKNERPFHEDDLQTFVALAHQVGIAIENAALYDEIQHLFEGFISASVQAIESRDPTTSGHSGRVALLTCALAEEVTRTSEGPYEGCRFNPDQIKEIRYAALLHDFGKVGIREHILVKARKLYPAELALVKARFDFIKRTLEVEMLTEKVAILQQAHSYEQARLLADLNREFLHRLQDIDKVFEFILLCDEPNVAPPAGFDRLHDIAKRQYVSYDGSHAYLTSEEVAALSVRFGSLTSEERHAIENHVTHTFEFLSKIPWTQSLQHVPMIAFSHHEKLDGTGYPRKVVGEEIPVQSRMLTICDIYDALTASDRPYKAAMPLSKALEILGAYAKEGKIDAALLNVFINAKVYQVTARIPHTAKSMCA